MVKKYYIGLLILLLSVFIINFVGAEGGASPDDPGSDGSSSGSGGGSETEISVISGVAKVSKKQGNYFIEIPAGINLKMATSELRETLFVERNGNKIPLLEATDITVTTILFFQLTDGSFVPIAGILTSSQGVSAHTDISTRTVPNTFLVALYCDPEVNLGTSGYSLWSNSKTLNQIFNSLKPIIFCKEEASDQSVLVQRTPSAVEQPPAEEKTAPVVNNVDSAKKLFNIFTKNLVDILNPSEENVSRSTITASYQRIGKETFSNAVYEVNGKLVVAGRISGNKQYSSANFFTADGKNLTFVFPFKKGVAALRLTEKQQNNLISNSSQAMKNPITRKILYMIKSLANLPLSNADLIDRLTSISKVSGNADFANYALIATKPGRVKGLGNVVPPGMQVNELFVLDDNLNVKSKSCQSLERVSLIDLANAKINC